MSAGRVSRHLLAMLLCWTVLAASAGATAQNPAAAQPGLHPSRYLAYKPRAAQLTGPLRYENNSAQEVGEIESAARGVLSGALVNISGIVAGCGCEEGPECSAQVRVVAYGPARSPGLSLSRIGGHWALGLLQQWELRYEAFRGQHPAPNFGTGADGNARFERFLAEQTALFEDYPRCDDELTADSSAPGR